jgi:hypothetical protein
MPAAPGGYTLRRGGLEAPTTEPLMAQLFFKKSLQIAIREGRKRTTIRRWPEDRPGIRGGQRVFSPGLGWLSVEAVEPVDLDSLGDEDAGADGFDTAARLRQVLLSLYPAHASDGKHWFRVRFSVEQLRSARVANAAEPDPY